MAANRTPMYALSLLAPIKHPNRANRRGKVFVQVNEARLIAVIRVRIELPSGHRQATNGAPHLIALGFGQFLDVILLQGESDIFRAEGRIPDRAEIPFL